MIAFSVFENKLFGEAVSAIGEADSKAYLKVRIARWIKAIQEGSKEYSDAKNELIKKHAEKDDDGKAVENEDGGVTIKPENMQALNEEFKDLLKVEFEAPELRHSWIEHVKIKDMAFLELMPFLTLDIEEEKDCKD